MDKYLGWKRKEFTTKGPDPTVVVEWSKEGVTIQEFQNVYSITSNGQDVPLDDFGMIGAAKVHQDFERMYSDDLCGADPDDEPAEFSNYQE